ncbi:MAG: S8 family serine peptidase [Flavobacteriales bacterium]|nr:S8 family serine peptidase [Flavobacteriales bacterium]
MMKYIKILALSFSLLLLYTSSHAQFGDKPVENWYHLDFENDGIPGMSTDRAYSELLEGKKGQKVIVAVLDSGVDPEHEDLDDRIWTNEDEIPGNGIDDDSNGYVDDIHGWNYLGNATEDITYDNLEFTRVYRALNKRFEGLKESTVSSADAKDYARYVKMKDQYEKRVKKAQDEAAEFLFFVEFYNQSVTNMADYFKVSPDNLSAGMMNGFEPTNPIEEAMKELVTMGLDDDFEKEIKEGQRHFESMLEYSYNLDYDSRAIIGDDPNKLDELGYGNNRVAGPRGTHGTHVAGIIGAERYNDLGMNGAADNVELMVLRCVPDGDEHDKDVANAIRYAVDNGARVINMSFGKSYSPQKEYVDAAVKYAETNGVLLVHASGNSNKNNDKTDNFPNAEYKNSGKKCSTWLEVGASGPSLDTNLVASFSNYGKKTVDIFAPGVSIYSTLPGSEYGRNQGTSMAAPMVSGVAALLMSYYPELTATEVKEIIEDSGVVYKKVKVYIPGTKKKTKLKKISTTGAIISVYNAVQLAEKKTAS